MHTRGSHLPEATAHPKQNSIRRTSIVRIGVAGDIVRQHNRDSAGLEICHWRFVLNQRGIDRRTSTARILGMMESG